jgi:hypothetical protein
LFDDIASTDHKDNNKSYDNDNNNDDDDEGHDVNNKSYDNLDVDYKNRNDYNESCYVIAGSHDRDYDGNDDLVDVAVGTDYGDDQNRECRRQQHNTVVVVVFATNVDSVVGDFNTNNNVICF